MHCPPVFYVLAQPPIRAQNWIWKNSMMWRSAALFLLNSPPLCPWKHEGGCFYAFSFICCHALSVHIIISITKPAVCVKCKPANPEKINETLNDVQWTGNFSQCDEHKFQIPVSLGLGHTATLCCHWGSMWTVNTPFTRCVSHFLRTSPAYDSVFAYLNIKVSRPALGHAGILCAGSQKQKPICFLINTKNMCY